MILNQNDLKHFSDILLYFLEVQICHIQVQAACCFKRLQSLSTGYK